MVHGVTPEFLYSNRQLLKPEQSLDPSHRPAFRVYGLSLCKGTKGPLAQSQIISQASQLAQTVKNLTAMKETQLQALGWDDFLEKGMATHSSILALLNISNADTFSGLSDVQASKNPPFLRTKKQA